MSTQRTFHRAVLHVTEVVSTTTDNGYVQERDALRIAEVAVTGDNPADALAQMQRHVDELAEWHMVLEREQEADRPLLSMECEHNACAGCDGQASVPGYPPCQHDCHKPTEQAGDTDGR